MSRKRFFKLESILMIRWKAKLDKLVIFFTREMGKLLAIAPGARRIPNRFGGTMEPLNYGTLMLYLSTSGKYYVKEFSVANSFLGIRSSSNRLSSALSYLFFLNEILPYGVPEAKLFDTTFSFFRELEKGGDPELLRIVALAKALYLLGFLPEFKVCSNCGRALKDAAYLKDSSSGPLCESCSLKSGSFNLGGESIALIRAFQEKPLSFFKKVNFSPRALNEVFNYLRAVFEKVSGGVELEFSRSDIQA
ncbi:MAG: DNA repair protein RecO [Synergistetes bacterium]|nr:DNA repair protein RecO [Synergistota bacterium]